MTNIQLSTDGLVLASYEMGQCKDQGPDGHQQDAESNPARFRGSGPATKVRQWDEDAEGGKVIGTGHGCELGGLEVEASLDGRDADID